MPHWRIQVPQGIDEPHLESTAILEEMEVWRCLIQWLGVTSTCNMLIQHPSRFFSLLPVYPRWDPSQISSRSETIFEKSCGQKSFWTKTGKQFEKKQHINQTLIKNIVQTHKKNMLKHLAPTLVGQESVTFLRLKFRETSKQTNVLRL